MYEHLCISITIRYDARPVECCNARYCNYIKLDSNTILKVALQSVVKQMVWHVFSRARCCVDDVCPCYVSWSNLWLGCHQDLCNSDHTLFFRFFWGSFSLHTRQRVSDTSITVPELQDGPGAGPLLDVLRVFKWHNCNLVVDIILFNISDDCTRLESTRSANWGQHFGWMHRAAHRWSLNEFLKQEIHDWNNY